jgi:hypothetical protein
LAEAADASRSGTGMAEEPAILPQRVSSSYRKRGGTPCRTLDMSLSTTSVNVPTFCGSGRASGRTCL